jgi:hypothetical protein
MMYVHPLKRRLNKSIVLLTNLRWSSSAETTEKVTCEIGTAAQCQVADTTNRLHYTEWPAEWLHQVITEGGKERRLSAEEWVVLARGHNISNAAYTEIGLAENVRTTKQLIPLCERSHEEVHKVILVSRFHVQFSCLGNGSCVDQHE